MYISVLFRWSPVDSFRNINWLVAVGCTSKIRLHSKGLLQIICRLYWYIICEEILAALWGSAADAINDLYGYTQTLTCI